MTRSNLVPLVALLLLTLPLSAQTNPDTTVLTAEVITATRVAGALRNPTTTATVLHGDVLRSQGVTHLADALRSVPGLAVVRSSSFGSPTALFLRGGQSNYVRVLIDGVPLNEPGGVLDLGRISLDDIDRIEVVRGPASVLYGSEAVTGVIQLFTRRGARRKSSVEAGPTALRAELGGGSHSSRRAVLGADGGLGPVTWTLSGEHQASDGVLPFNNEYRNDGISSSLAIDPDASTDLRITARLNRSTYRYPTGSDGSLEDRNAERTEHRLMLGLDGSRRWSDRLETRVTLSASEFLPRTNDGADGVADTLGFYGFFARATVRRVLADMRSTLRLGIGQRFTMGGEFARDTERGSSLSLSEFGDFPDEFRAARETRAVYSQVLGDLGALSYSLGARLDENSAFGSFHTVRAGIAWRMASAIRVRASTGTAFKAPSFFENFASGFTVGNGALRPERSRSAELGIEAVLSHGALVRMTGFTQRFRDLVQYTGSPPTPGDPNYYNIAAANAGGVEFEATLPDVAGFLINAGYTWTDTRVSDAGFASGPSASFVTGGRLLRRPEHVASLGLTRQIDGVGAFTVGAIRTGQREDRDFSTFPAAVAVLAPFTLVDVSSEYQLPSRLIRDAQLMIRVENVAGTRFSQIAGFDAPGRTLFAGLKLQR